jgi:hypothetical protein
VKNTESKLSKIPTNTKLVIGLALLGVLTAVGVTVKRLVDPDLVMTATPCTQGESVSEWLGSQTAFLEHGYQLHTKPSNLYDSWIFWDERGIISGHDIFPKSQLHLIQADTVINSYKQCRDFLEAHHADQSFSKTEVSNYLTALDATIERNSRLDESRKMLVSFAGYFKTRYGDHLDVNDDVDFEFRRYLTRRFKELDKNYVSEGEVDQFIRGYEVSTLLGAMSAILVYADNTTASDKDFDFIEELVKNPEKFGLSIPGGAANEVKPQAVLRGFENSSRYLDKLKENGKIRLSAADATILISKIMAGYLDGKDPKDALELNKSWVNAWVSNRYSDESKVKNIVDKLTNHFNSHALEVMAARSAEERIVSMRAAMQSAINIHTEELKNVQKLVEMRAMDSSAARSAEDRADYLRAEAEIAIKQRMEEVVKEREVVAGVQQSRKALDSPEAKPPQQ